MQQPAAWLRRVECPAYGDHGNLCCFQIARDMGESHPEDGADLRRFSLLHVLFPFWNSPECTYHISVIC